MSSVPITNVKIDESTSQRKEESKNSINNPSVEIKESFSLSDNDNKTKKIIKVQEENINGNYGRIFVQESSSNRDGFKSNSNLNSENNKNRPVQQRETKKIIITQNNSQINNNKRKNYSISVDNKYTKEKNKNPKNKNLRSKSIVRGGDYKNILVTHTIYASTDIDFHIIDPLMVTTNETRKKYMSKIDEKNRNGRNGKVRVTTTCSCDKIKLKPKDKLKLNGETKVIEHRKNGSVVKISVKNNDNKRINKERKEGKEGKDSIIKINIRNVKKDNNTNKGNSGGLSASYKKRNQKNNNTDGINIKKINY